jgi:hypothetical protein
MFENINPAISFEQFYNNQGRAVESFLLSERGFYFFSWLLAKISRAPQLLIFTTSAFNVFCAYNFIKKNSEDKEISFMAFVCLGSLTFSMNGMRQALAMSICLLSYEFVKKRKLIPFLITVLIAVLFHKTAIVFLPVYFLYKIKFNATGITVVFASLAGFVIFANNIAILFDDIADADYALGAAVESGGFVTIAIYVICIVAMLMKCKRLKENENVRCAFNMTVFGMIMYSARYFSVQMYERISYYFFFFTFLLLANIPKESKYERVLKEGIILLSFLLFAYRTNGGSFKNFTLFFLK